MAIANLLLVGNSSLRIGSVMLISKVGQEPKILIQTVCKSEQPFQLVYHCSITFNNFACNNMLNIITH
jgi:hypothetical protein